MLVIGFLLIIFLGAFILKLPISNKNGKNLSFIDSLFTATSAVCVTGLNTIVPADQFTTFGKIILMILIELGGIGFMSFVVLILIIMRKKINLSNRILIKESLNQTNDNGVVSLIIKILKYISIIELIGALILLIEFLPEYGIKKGIFCSIFHSISAVCNAGFDILGDDGFIRYQYNPIISLTIMFLIIIGGLGFSVWVDIIESLKKIIKKNINFLKIYKELTTHTKIVIMTSIILLLLGTIFVFCFEQNNILMKNDKICYKILKSAFYSTTLRTAGFETIDSSNCMNITKYFSMIFMLIGASPASTGGGIKTTTFAICILFIVSYLKGNEEIIVFKRKIPEKLFKRAIVIIFLSLFVIGISIIALVITENIQFDSSGINHKIEFTELLFECFSAFGTVGLSLGITPSFSKIGKIIIMLLMFIGRIGPITVSYALINKVNKQKSVKYPECDILVG